MKLSAKNQTRLEIAVIAALVTTGLLFASHNWDPYEDLVKG